MGTSIESGHDDVLGVSEIRLANKGGLMLTGTSKQADIMARPITPCFQRLMLIVNGVAFESGTECVVPRLVLDELVHRTRSPVE